jgi:catechol 2,3-dioxygenase-like lactoylglutathione lyase family enzyme
VDIFEKIRQLNLPNGSYVVVGGAVLQAHGIREANDIDILVTPKIYKQFKMNGWPEQETGTDRWVLIKDVFEVGKDWNFKKFGYRPKVKDLIKKSETINSIPFVRLEEILRWKRALGRPKDVPDILLIESYLMPKPLGVEPLIYVKNLARSIKFYTEVLGFKLGELYPNKENPTYAPIFAGEHKVVLVTARAMNKKFYMRGLGGSGMQLFLPVENVDYAYKKIKIKEKIKFIDDIETKSWGDREFTISDPDGYLVTFYKSY